MAALKEYLDRETLLYRLAREVSGIYAPRFYSFEHAANQTITKAEALKEGLPIPLSAAS